MDFINALVNFFKKKHQNKQRVRPEGMFPICWGYDEYDGKIRKIYKDRQVDVNNHKDSPLLIQTLW